MNEVMPNLWVGNASDFEQLVRNNDHNWAVVHACKEPYHRRLLGYKTAGAPKDHPEYLFAVRDRSLFLNMIDVDDPKWVQKPIIDVTLKFVKSSLDRGLKTLIHCNQGESRAPSLALLYMASQNLLDNSSFEMAEKEFIHLYPKYSPKKGIRSWIKSNLFSYITCH